MSAIELLDAGELVDVSLHGNGLFSRKEAGKCSDSVFSITHAIDDSETFFDRAGIIEVLAGKRSAWDGNLKGDN